MGHVGDVDAHLPYAVAYAAYRQRVVEVLGIGRVDREGGHAAEVAPAVDFLLRDAAVDGGGRLLDFGLEAVGELVLGQNGVHLRVVVARQTQHVNQLAHGALAPERPLGDADHHLLAVLDLGILLFGQEDVHGHLARIGLDENLVGPHLRNADIGLAAPLDDARHLALHLAAARLVGDDHLDTVAVEGVGRIALVDEDILFEPLDADVERTSRGHVGNALEVGQMGVGEAVLAARALLDDALVEEPFEDVERLAAPLLRGAARDRSQVLERELVVGELAEYAQNDGFAVAFSCSSGGACFRLSCHQFSNICRARRFMKPMPTGIARSSGQKVAVWGRPASGPTPSR